MFGGITFAGATFAGVVGILGPLPAVPTNVGIVIGGIEVTARVRVQGVTIRDVLNDAPNTASLTIEGDAPAVGQPITITIGGRLLFAGALQTIDQAYESLPTHVAWHLTAIDDTGRVNMRRPFGTFVETSATTIAQTITTQFAPGFATTGIAAGLPTVTITFDGADTFIACLARLATAVGGYCKIDDRRVYLFLTDPADPPDPIDAAHRFLTNPPITLNTDASQLRTRVYGKGYGENVTADLAAGETLWPIQDGANFPPLGGTAIAGLTADGAQSEKITFTGVVRGTAGSLVGPGAAPANAPLLELQGGSGCDPGLHTVSVCYVTATGRSLAGPPASITTGTMAWPASAPVAGAATNGTGPDAGSHDYVVSFVTAYGETLTGPASNPMTASASSGQVDPPGGPTPTVQKIAGNLPSVQTFDYRATFINATGETAGGGTGGGQSAPGLPQGSPHALAVTPTDGGALTPGAVYYYAYSFVCDNGFETPANMNSAQVTLPAGSTAAMFSMQVPNPWGDGRTTKYRAYRTKAGDASGNRYLVGEFPNDGTWRVDTKADSALGALWPTTNVGPDPGHQITLAGVAAGPAGVTARKLYRRTNGAGAYYYIGTINNNTTTSYSDNLAAATSNPVCPESNTTGTAVQRIPLSAIPIGPAGVTGRKLYRRFNAAGTFKLVTTLANNTTTAYTDTTPNSGLGAAALITPTAIGNQIKATIPIGPPGALYREFFMSPVGDPIRRQIGGITDNVTTQITLATPDSVILTGFVEPTSDLSGLQQPQGQVNPGATTLPVAYSGPFRPSGGWLVLSGGQVVKHTGISGNNLTGIPASGSGAITTTVLYGQQVIPSPMLVGVSGLTKPLAKGSAVHIWVQRDDTLAQSEHAARTGTDGVVEFLIVDSRRGVASLTARCDADLKLFSRPILTVQYATRDMKTASGKTVTIDLASPAIHATMIIQEVTITEIDIAPGLAPRFTVKASTVRFSLDDTLRRLIAGGLTSVND